MFAAIRSIIPILAIIVLGYFLKATRRVSEDFNGNVSFLVMNVALPASIFVSVMRNLTLSSMLELSEALLTGAASVVIGYGAAFLLVRLLKIRPGRRGVFINTLTNANTIFIGMPLNMALFDGKAMPYFLVYYILNTVSTWAVGIFLITGDPSVPGNGGQAKEKLSLKKLLPPPLIGFLVALLALFSGLPVPEVVTVALGYLGNLVTPLSLIYIGIVLCDAGLSSVRFDRDTTAGLLGRFVLSPAVMLAVLAVAGRIRGALPAEEINTFIVQSAVPALTVLPILAGEGKGDVRYATNLVTTSTVLFVIVIPIVTLLCVR